MADEKRLQNTYYNGRIAVGKSPQRKFHMVHNCENSIEDPIFTGFTFDIDEKHSPLFFMPYDTTETLNDTTETLRSIGGGNTKLATVIENRLEKLYNSYRYSNTESYEINTLNVKDKGFGYGLQDKFYLDNVQYGAVDYIYMVDKVTKGRFSDNVGVADIGNGTPSGSTETREYASVLKSRTDMDISTLYQNDINQIKGGIDKAKDEIDKEIEDLGEDADKEYKKKKAEMEAAKDTLEKKSVEGKKDEKALEELNTNIDSQLQDVKIEFEEFKKRADELLSKYMEKRAPIRAEKPEEIIYDTIRNDSEIKTILYDIHKLYEQIKKFEKCDGDSIRDVEKKKYSERYNTLDYKLKIEAGAGLLSLMEKIKVYLDNEDKKAYAQKLGENVGSLENSDDKAQKKAVKKRNEKLNKYVKEVLNGDGFLWRETEPINKEESSLAGLIEVFAIRTASLVSNPSSEKQKEKRDLQQKVNTFNDELKPLEKSYQDAQKDYDNDPITKKLYEKKVLEDIENKASDLKDYSRKNSDKAQVENTLPSVDIEYDDKGNITNMDKINSVKYSRETYEVPQTVYDMMGFINSMKKIKDNYPYVFQSVTGLDEAYKNYFLLKDPYQGSGEGKITINCLESLDLRVSSMFNKYFNAVYDRQYKRERVPINLRRFECSIFVHDIRNFRNALGFDNKSFEEFEKKNTENLKTIVQMALNYISVVEFKFFDCEIVPEETGNIFDSVSNAESGEMKKTNFTFTYGNCVINFLPFEDVRKYLLEDKAVENIKPTDDTNVGINEYTTEDFTSEKMGVTEEVSGVTIDDVNKKNKYLDANGDGKISYDETIRHPKNYKVIEGITADKYNQYLDTNKDGKVSHKELGSVDEGNFRRWFDRSELGNVSNNDYRDYVRKDSYVAVDDYYKTSIVNNFALNSVVNKNKELTAMDDALRRIVVGISASTGIPTKGVADALNVGYLKSVFNEQDLAAPIVKDLGNVTNSRINSRGKMEYIGNTVGGESKETTITDLGNVFDTTQTNTTQMRRRIDIHRRDD